ncbi:hypothetical protein GCM10008171_29200 [Methylopila jiangsuensis]|uniref:Uncharacterized protein n=1 Tax=Methylopila jiangsuensis TaxID=586230 RepID=A0A9W6N4W5_9HYPH|nr:hypothetical protein [Methylopila jiangsuensis]MDR6284946.1 hypothetical protein [Methylopila jiangsuensis]GLK77666.1 hypothetical protein GCM10008171_29200 [Methylopila jiangsuensis]
MRSEFVGASGANARSGVASAAKLAVSSQPDAASVIVGKFEFCLQDAMSQPSELPISIQTMFADLVERAWTGNLADLTRGGGSAYSREEKGRLCWYWQPGTDRGKRPPARNDIQQAGALIEVLSSQRPDDLKAVWEELNSHGASWREMASRSFDQLPPNVRAALGDGR